MVPASPPGFVGPKLTGTDRPHPGGGAKIGWREQVTLQGRVQITDSTWQSLRWERRRKAGCFAHGRGALGPPPLPPYPAPRNGTYFSTGEGSLHLAEHSPRPHRQLLTRVSHDLRSLQRRVGLTGMLTSSPARQDAASAASKAFHVQPRVQWTRKVIACAYEPPNGPGLPTDLMKSNGLREHSPCSGWKHFGTVWLGDCRGGLLFAYRGSLCHGGMPCRR